MTLKELQDVLRATELPIVLFTNRLRWGECESREEAEDHIFQLADFVTIKADLKDHIFPLEQILKICEAGSQGAIPGGLPALPLGRAHLPVCLHIQGRTLRQLR
jgi:hypothetical protein